MLYLDSSALLKLVIVEKESRALRSFLKREAAERVSCTLARTEILRATRPHGTAALERARGLLQTLQLVQLDDVLLDAAGLLDPVKMRSLDAIHLATALGVGPTLTSFVTYDDRLADAARALGLPVVSPA
jgi:predicted nucleic acid-binding protein